MGEARCGVAVAQRGQEHASHLGPGGAGETSALGRDHRPLRLPLSQVDAGQLVCGLDHAGRAQHPASVDQFRSIEHPGPGHGTGQCVHRHPAAGHVPEDFGDGRAHPGGSVVELGPQRVAKLGAGGHRLANRIVGMQPNRPRLRADDGHCTAVIGVAGVDGHRNMPGGVTNVGATQQHGPVHALSLHLGAQASEPLRSHAPQVGPVQARYRP